MSDCPVCAKRETELAEPISAPERKTHEVISVRPTGFRVEVAVLSQDGTADAIGAAIFHLAQAVGTRKGFHTIDDKGGMVVGTWVEK